MRCFPDTGPRSQARSEALKSAGDAEPDAGEPAGPAYIGAFGKDGNWLEE